MEKTCFRIAFALFLLLNITACKDSFEPVQDCNQSNLALILVSQTDTDCETAAGRIEVRSTGGSGVKMFQLDEGPFQTSPVFNSVSAGPHMITVKDASNCTAKLSLQLFSGISFKASIKPIIEKSCAISNCHDGTGNVDFNNFQNLKNNPKDVKARTQSRNMPKTGSLTDAEIKLIACWVDEGALNN
jgi:hypothetical protein